MLGSTNISVTLVRNTLGESSNSVGKLCSSDKINKWSVFKPIPRPIDEINDPNWYKGNPTYNPYGIKVETYTGINHQMFKTGKWEYTKPTGGANSIYALGDFRKYNHTATVPIQATLPDKLYTKQSNLNHIAALIVQSTDENTGQVAVDILNPLLGVESSGSIKMGICIVNSSGSWTWRTANLGFHNLDLSPLGSQFKSNIDVILFLTNVTQDSWAVTAQTGMLTACLPEETVRWKHYDTLDDSEPVYEPTWTMDMSMVTKAPANVVTVPIRFTRSRDGIFPIRLAISITSVISSYKTEYNLDLEANQAVGNLGDTYTFNVPIRGLLMTSSGNVGSYTREFPILVISSVMDRANHNARMGGIKLTIDPNYTER